jgi:serine/threonine-protein kinase/endoribonuclease IRE1
VIRYYFQEARHNFLYIALELCPASLADIIERPDNPKFTEISCSFDPKRALMQITSGLRWLHGLKIIHRDIKPQNILVAYSKSNLRLGSASRSTKGSQHRMLISDFGLCKKLGADETSFVPTVHGAMAAGTVGWRAPEILRGEVKVDETSIPTDDSQSSRGSVVNGQSPNGNSHNRTRLTKSVDVFALGCLFYYTLTSGSHPYGDRYERDMNIMRDNKDLSGLQSFGEEGVEAVDLISKMLSPESSQRYYQIAISFVPSLIIL